MGLIIWGGVVPACLAAAWLIVRRPIRQLIEEWHVEQARVQFRQRREWLEARFLTALGQFDPIERLRWDEAHWHDEILWARDRQSRVFLALIGVHFDDPAAPTDAISAPHPPRHATALFEYRKGHWLAEGKRLDEIRPDEAVLRGQRFEPVVPHPRRAY